MASTESCEKKHRGSGKRTRSCDTSGSSFRLMTALRLEKPSLRATEKREMNHELKKKNEKKYRKESVYDIPKLCSPLSSSPFIIYLFIYFYCFMIACLSVSSWDAMLARSTCRARSSRDTSLATASSCGLAHRRNKWATSEREKKKIIVRHLKFHLFRQSVECCMRFERVTKLYNLLVFTVLTRN